MMADDAEMDEEIEKQLEAEARNNVDIDQAMKIDDNVKIKQIPLILLKNYLKNISICHLSLRGFLDR